MPMTQLELIEELFDGIGENISPEDRPIRRARLSVACKRGLQLLAIAVESSPRSSTDSVILPTRSIRLKSKPNSRISTHSLAR